MIAEKHDGGKPMWNLLPFDGMAQVVDVLTFGAKKYAPGAWRFVPDAKQRYLAAALRHLVAWARGERIDKESGLHHLAHAACCILFLLELDDKDDSDGRSAQEAEADLAAVQSR